MCKFRNLNIYFFIIFVFFFCLSFVSADNTCTYTYAYSRFKYGGEFGSEEVNPAGKGATISFDVSTKVGTVTKRADYKLFFGLIDNSYTFGETSTLSAWTEDVCPLYIAVHANTTNWKGYSSELDIESDFADVSDSTMVSVFMNDNPEMPTYTCHYEGFNIVFDSDGKAIYAKDTLSNSGIQFSYSLDSSLTEQKAVEPGVCENVYTCVTSSVPSTTPGVPSIRYYNVYSGSIDLASKQDTECLDSVITLFSVIKNEEFSEEEGDNSACRTYGTHWDFLETSYNTCKVNLNSCGIYNNYKLKLKSWCNSVTKFVDYGDVCLDRCLELNDKILELEKSEGKYSKCGLSDNLIIWIANIVKWGKYLIPVIVIVLGILDFIKAMASDKDDEMKKAQGSFVKRLIAAALIFIVPFIIEFVLDMMGFDANGCGIIDL